MLLTLWWRMMLMMMMRCLRTDCQDKSQNITKQTEPNRTAKTETESQGLIRTEGSKRYILDNFWSKFQNTKTSSQRQKFDSNHHYPDNALHHHKHPSKTSYRHTWKKQTNQT
jgi:hypothetical protein